MKIKNINISVEEIKAFCLRWKVTEFALFGSVLRDDFHSNSDIDVMVQFDSEDHRTFVDLEDMQVELANIFDREVDVITREGIENSRNYLRRREILNSAQIIYEQRQSVST